MTTEEKKQVVGLLEEIAESMNRWTFLESKVVAMIINDHLDKYPIIPGRMGDDLKAREEG